MEKGRQKKPVSVPTENHNIGDPPPSLLRCAHISGCESPLHNLDKKARKKKREVTNQLLGLGLQDLHETGAFSTTLKETNGSVERESTTLKKQTNKHLEEANI
jgi:hypothetical protein